MNNFHTQQTEALFTSLKAGPDGLSTKEAEKRIEEFGPNLLPLVRPTSLFRIVIRQFLNPLIYVLVIVGVVSIIIGHVSDSLFIFGILLFNSIIGAFQEYGAEKSALALRQVAKTRARARRDGETVEIGSEKLVPGDVVLLESGDKVPADIRLFSASSLTVDESLLTGESDAASKDAGAMLPEETSLGDRKNLSYAGTLVNQGRGQGVVVATGTRTELGKIAGSVLEAQGIKTPLLIRMEHFSRWVAIWLGLVVLLMSGVLIFKGTPFTEVLLLAVALGVAAIPEGLPIALTVALSIASRKMAKKNVIVRKLAAVEALGSCTYIGTDKTGTLTVNELTVRQLKFANLPMTEVTGTGVSLGGKILSSEEKLLSPLIEAVMLCNEASLNNHEGKLIGRGDAVDVALLVLGRKFDLEASLLQKKYKKIDEIPYESEKGFAATMHIGSEGKLISVKGAMEKLLPLCQKMLTLEGEVPCAPGPIEADALALAEQGLRVLAVARRPLPADEHGPNLESELKELTFLGLVGMIDPLRTEVKDAVHASHRAGIQVAMITGDHPTTALTIAKELGLASSMSEVLTGQHLRKMSSPEEVDRNTRNAKVFARVDPRQKLEIVESMRRLGHFVAVTGDGANDAPALKAAHVGVAMGKSGTDVARETADLILADDSFSSIVAGIEEGRIAYSNVRKVIYLLISTGGAEVLLFLLCIITGLPMPLTAIQLLWLNVVTNGIQDKALAFEPGEGDELAQNPRPPREPIFNRPMLERITLSSLVVGGVSFLFYQHLITGGSSHFEAQNLTLLQMVLFENVMVGNARSETKSSLSISPFNNLFLFLGTISAQLIHIAAMYLPWLRDVLGVAPVTLKEWMTSLALALSVFVAIEILKWFRRKTWADRVDPPHY